MKKPITILLFGFLALSQAFSQEYKPRETWPFIYEEFKEGAARMRSGDLVSEAPFNVAVHDGSLMYVDGEGIIMRADMSRVYTAKVGDDIYVNVLGKIAKVGRKKRRRNNHNSFVLFCLSDLFFLFL